MKYLKLVVDVCYSYTILIPILNGYILKIPNLEIIMLLFTYLLKVYLMTNKKKQYYFIINCLKII